MTRLTIDINKSSDLLEILEVLHRLNIPFSQTAPVAHNLSATDIEGYLSIDKIKILYPNEWVLLAYTQKEGITIQGGVVLVHHADKREMALKGKDLIQQYPYVAHLYTGDFPQRGSIGIVKKVNT